MNIADIQQIKADIQKVVEQISRIYTESPGGSTGQYVNAAREFLLKAQTELDTVENEITDS